MDNDKMNHDNESGKTKQKAGLGAIRPDDKTEQLFKQMAADNFNSQTECFQAIFYHYLNDQADLKKTEALNCDGEISIISKDLNDILYQFKSISKKAQDKIISVQSNAKQEADNFLLDKETFQSRIDYLEKRNNELEKTNSVFTEVKQSLEDKIIKLEDINVKQSSSLKTTEESLKDKDKKIMDAEDFKEKVSREMHSLQMTITRLTEELEVKSSKIHNLEISNDSLNATINELKNLQTAHLEAIEAGYKSKIADLESKLNSQKDNNQETINQALKNQSIIFEADKKLAISELKLELADCKEKLAHALTAAK